MLKDIINAQPISVSDQSVSVNCIGSPKLWIDGISKASNCWYIHTANQLWQPYFTAVLELIWFSKRFVFTCQVWSHSLVIEDVVLDQYPLLLVHLFPNKTFLATFYCKMYQPSHCGHQVFRLVRKTGRTGYMSQDCYSDNHWVAEALLG